MVQQGERNTLSVASDTDLVASSSLWLLLLLSSRCCCCCYRAAAVVVVIKPLLLLLSSCSNSSIRLVSSLAMETTLVKMKLKWGGRKKIGRGREANCKRGYLFLSV